MGKLFKRGATLALAGVLTASTVFPALNVQADADIAAENQSEISQFMDCFFPMPIMDPDGLSTDCWGAAEVGPRDRHNGLEDDDMSDYSYWDGGIIKDEASGKYYMFASRWDQRGGHEGVGEYPGWRRSEAIYAVSDNLYGPYVDQGLIWPDYHGGVGHNVYPFVLSDSDPLYAEGYRYGIVLGDPWEVGGTIHVSKTLENGGDWTHLDQMNCDGSFTMTNISIFVRPDGRYQAVSRTGDIATTDSVNGPWHVESNGLWWNLPGLDTSVNDMEDPVMWYSDGMYHCLVNKWDAKQAYYITSLDGFTNWTLQEGKAYTPHQNFLSYEDGTENNWTKLERPNVYIEDGELKAMLLSVINVEKTDDRPNDQNGSKIIVTPFDGAALKDFADDRYVGLLPEGDSNIQTWQNERYNNYGRQPYLQVQGVPGVAGLGESGNSGWWWPDDWNYDCKIGFLKYDLSELETEKEIESAYLSLNYLGKKAGDADTDSVRVVLSDPDWWEGWGKDEDTSEDDITCLNLPKLQYDAADLENTSVVSEEFPINEGAKTVKTDVTKLVKEFQEKYPDGQHISFALNETQGVNRLHFGSKDAGEGYGARLIINYKEDSTVQADNSSLKLAIGMAEKMEAEQAKSNCYTEDTWAAVQTALDEARTLVENPEAAQQAVDNALLNLITACNLLESNAQRTGLKAAIDGTKAILADSTALEAYTPESVQAVRDALAYAESVYALEGADQTTINAAATGLMTAVNSLLIEQGDTRLDVLIRKAEELLKNKDQYTDASAAALEEALEAAKTIAADSQATPEAEKKAYDDLAAAMTALVRKAEKSELKNALDKANEILANFADYVADTITGLAAATEKAQGIYDDQNADAFEVGNAVKELVSEILKARLKGDVNMDGNVDTADSAEVLQYAAECKELTEEQHKAADVNEDGVSDSSDAAGILQYASEKKVEF
ncbi:dockerin type I domain-containing protein [Robinsoniella peoriensis]|uniref:dockerin type I domain-containing protein n=1 Tax=Robinsoniella peoriensis TaxID=180332 RepID=UPI0037538949